jgi:hypothetical protein
MLMELLQWIWAVVKILLGSCAGLLLLFYLWDWRITRKQSRIHRRALQKCSTEEIESRARTLSYLERYAHTEAVKEVQSLLAQRRYADILRHWRDHSRELYKVGDNTNTRTLEFYETMTGEILHDYLVVLLKRQKAAARGKG